MQKITKRISHILPRKRLSEYVCAQFWWTES